MRTYGRRMNPRSEVLSAKARMTNTEFKAHHRLPLRPCTDSRPLQMSQHPPGSSTGRQSTNKPNLCDPNRGRCSVFLSLPPAVRLSGRLIEEGTSCRGRVRFASPASGGREVLGEGSGKPTTTTSSERKQMPHRGMAERRRGRAGQGRGKTAPPPPGGGIASRAFRLSLGKEKEKTPPYPGRFLTL
jgi:hypothetical protein